MSMFFVDQPLAVGVGLGVTTSASRVRSQTASRTSKRKHRNDRPSQPSGINSGGVSDAIPRFADGGDPEASDGKASVMACSGRLTTAMTTAPTRIGAFSLTTQSVRGTCPKGAGAVLFHPASAVSDSGRLADQRPSRRGQDSTCARYRRTRRHQFAHHFECRATPTDARSR
jgi:hypothetical protein